MEPTSTGGDGSDGEDDVPLGTFLYEALPDSEIDSVESVRELRERE
ncbi:hypothetical protein C500_20855 [Natrialba magadii ATCC 43099]|nr:hypothetical protein [Natrialba magadii]ELY22953.1 hypothetical protein C500_20855 [Natrialba magadii ATCC 43099]